MPHVHSGNTICEPHSGKYLRVKRMFALATTRGIPRSTSIEVQRMLFSGSHLWSLWQCRPLWLRLLSVRSHQIHRVGLPHLSFQTSQRPGLQADPHYYALSQLNKLFAKRNPKTSQSDYKETFSLCSSSRSFEDRYPMGILTSVKCISTFSPLYQGHKERKYTDPSPEHQGHKDHFTSNR